MANIGVEEFNYDTFQNVYDNDPSIQELVTDFDQNTITLGEPKLSAPDVDQGTDTVDRTAKAAAHRKLA